MLLGPLLLLPKFSKEVRPLFIPYSQVRPPPNQEPIPAILSPTMKEYETTFIPSSINSINPSFIPTRKPAPKKKKLLRFDL